MTVDTVIKTLENLSKAVVMADPRNLQELAGIHQGLEDLTGAPPAMAADAALAAKLLEEIILEDVKDKESAFSQVSAAIAGMQKKVRKLTAETQTVSDLGPIDNKTETNVIWPAGTDREIFAAFLAKRESMMEDLETAIINFEKKGTSENIECISRLFHTLKGEAGVLSLPEVSGLCHHAEDHLSLGAGKVSIDILLEVKDWLSQVFAAYAGNDTLPQSPTGLLERLMEYSTGREKNPMCKKGADAHIEGCEDCFADVNLAHNWDGEILQDFIHESRDHLQSAEAQLLALEKQYTDMEALNTVFRSFHTIKGLANFLGLKPVSSLSHITESLLNEARNKDLVLTHDPIELIFKAVDALSTEINNVEAAMGNGKVYKCSPDLHILADELSFFLNNYKLKGKKPLGQILVEERKATPLQIKTALKQQKKAPAARLGTILVSNGVVQSGDITDALNKQAPDQAPSQVKEVIKVETEKLDKLVDAIGELVIAESMITNDGEILDMNSSRIEANLRQLNKITRELQVMGMNMRMVTVKSTFQKMARVVRDLARKQGKDILFETSGEDTELDKNVIENISDPLLHMVRNAVDHGIETSEKRQKTGKPARAVIRLRAFQKGGTIRIEVEDDGKGLDKEIILEKALKLNIIRSGDGLTDQEIFNLTFHPGFSTAAVVSDVSGRGVGLDVVKKNIESLRGRVEIHSEPGRGTTFSMRLPLTMAIIDGMIVRVGKEKYIVPTISVIESLRPEQSQISSVLSNNEMITVHGRQVPLLHLSDFFGIDSVENDICNSIVVIVEDLGRKVGLVVDELLGQQQTVIKKLGEGLGTVQGISGGAIMSDGNICLILDVAGIMRTAARSGEKIL